MNKEKTRRAVKKPAPTKKHGATAKSASKPDIDLLSIINTFKDAIFTIDTDYCYTSFNTAHVNDMKNIFNVDIETGKSVLTYIRNADSRKLARERFDAVLKGNKSIEEEMPIGDQNIKPRYVKNSNRPIYNAEGVVTGVIVISEDITESKLLKELLEESEKNLKSFMDCSPWGMFVITQEKMNFQLLYANAAVAHIFGYEPEEIIKHPLEELIHPDYLGMVLNEIKSRFEGKPLKKSFPMRGLNKEKQIVYCKIYGILSNHQGKPAIVGMLEDVTAKNL